MSEKLKSIQREIQRLATIAVGLDEDKAIEAARQLHDFYIPQLPWPLDLQAARAIYDHAVLPQVQAIAGEDVGLTILMAVSVYNEFDEFLDSGSFKPETFEEVVEELAGKPKIDLEDAKRLSRFAISPDEDISLLAVRLMDKRIGELSDERDSLAALMAVRPVLESQKNHDALAIITDIHNRLVDKLAPPNTELVTFLTQAASE